VKKICPIGIIFIIPFILTKSMIPDLPDISEIIRFRKMAGLTQRRLAKRMSVSQSVISKFERGRRTPSYNLVRLMLEEIRTEIANKNNTCASIAVKNVITLKPSDTVRTAVDLMKKNNISQIPILDGKENIGSITETLILNLIDKYGTRVYRHKLTRNILGDPFKIISGEKPKSEAIKELKSSPAVLIKLNNSLGIITKQDVM